MSKKMTFWQRIEAHPWLALTAALVVYIGISLALINRWPIWFDEGYTFMISHFSYGEIASLTAVDVHPPLYYWLTHTWMSIFGYTEFGLRSFSLALGVVALVGIFMLVRRLTQSNKAAIAAMVLLSFSPVLIRYSNEGRMYTLVAAIVIWATYVLSRATAAKPQSWRWWILYGVLVGAGVLTQYFAALAWLAHWVWRFVQYRRGEIKKFFTKYWIGAHVLAIGLFAFWIPTAWHQVTGIQEGFWIPAVTGATFQNYIANTFMFLPIELTASWLALIYYAILGAIIAFIIVLYKKRKSKETCSLLPLIIMSVVPVVLLFVVSLTPPLQPTFVDRYVLYSSIFLVALVGIILFQFAWSRRARIVLIAIFTVGQLVGLTSLYVLGGFYDFDGKTPPSTRALIQEINKQDSSHTPIVELDDWSFYEAAAYSNDQHTVMLIDDGVYNWPSLYPARDYIRDHPDQRVDAEEAKLGTGTVSKMWIMTDPANYEKVIGTGWKVVDTVELQDQTLNYFRGLGFTKEDYTYKAYLIERI